MLSKNLKLTWQVCHKDNHPPSATFAQPITTHILDSFRMIAGMQSDKRGGTISRLFGFSLDESRGDSESQSLLFLEVQNYDLIN